MNKKALAFDFGASSGRAMAGEFDGEKITLSEVHRFSNDPVSVGSRVYWDVLRLFHEIKQGLLAAKNIGGFDSIGVDTWGVDFALLDKEGNLLENPAHYRDTRTNEIEQCDFYPINGIQPLYFNTVYQLSYLAQKRSELLKAADKMLFMPDYFNYLLTGVKSCEFSIASTSGLLQAGSSNWSSEILQKQGLNKDLFCEVSASGTVLGKLSPWLCDELSLQAVPVVAVCGHDTASAVVAVPASEQDFLYLSSGTWSLMGTELTTSLLSNPTITNEGGFGKTVRYLKNITGLWLIQESRRALKREGKEYSFAQLQKEAEQCEGGKCYIDTSASEFAVMGNLPLKIQQYCQKTKQFVPQTVGEIMRCIYDSLAQKYAITKSEIQAATGKEYKVLHMVGGGIKDDFLCKLTAKTCGCRVLAGPVEATALGNIAVQLIAMGEIKDIEHARKIIANSTDIIEYN